MSSPTDRTIKSPLPAGRGLFCILGKVMSWAPVPVRRRCGVPVWAPGYRSCLLYTSSAQIYTDFDGSETLENGGGIVEFADDCGEIDIEFGEEALFTVNANGQGDLNLKYDTDYNSDFAAMYDYANIDFLNFPGEPSFNRNGTLYIYADEDTYLYEVTADGAKELDAVWDEDYEAWRCV